MQFILIILSSILWGVTNPFIRKASTGLEKVKANNNFEKIFLELRFLFTNFNVSLMKSLYKIIFNKHIYFFFSI